MKVLVCGGRDFGEIPRGCPPEQRVAYANVAGKEQFLLREVLDEYDRDHGITVLIHGACKTGADAHADRWAKSYGIQVMDYPAQWRVNGRLDRSAGPRRNQRMVDEARPDEVIAFSGGDGTADMVRRARKAGIPVREIV